MKFYTFSDLIHIKLNSSLENLIGMSEKEFSKLSDKEKMDEIEKLSTHMASTDPDYYNYNNEHGHFIEQDGYIFTDEELNSDVKKMLSYFFENFKKSGKWVDNKWKENDAFTKKIRRIKDASWDDFHKLKHGIAYRGGSGYNYAIFEYLVNGNNETNEAISDREKIKQYIKECLKETSMFKH